jgi:predicted nucleotidyltransferase component of viral defense system
MISRIDIEQRVREWSLREDVIEKDYVIGWVLWGIGRNTTLRDSWAFKGGTCLKKCFIETYRFSEDLDFTVLPGGPIRPDDVRAHLLEVLTDVEQDSGIDLGRREPFLKGDESGRYTEARVYYIGPRATPGVASIKLDLSASERVVRSTEMRAVSHPYPDAPDEPGTVQCYCFEEIFAEKIRAMGERGRPRDLYDIVNLFRRQDLETDPEEIRHVLVEKCNSKGVPVPSLSSVLTPDIRAELESEWGNMLAHQLPELPPLDSFIDALTDLFAWLEGFARRPTRKPVSPYGAQEDVRWVPPPTAQTWGFEAPLETIRFAAVNHLLVDLGYGGTIRTIEPYSLRRTRAGNLVLHAIRADNGEHRAYRVDRIQSARATNRAFLPRYAIEFSPPPGP